jgi:hypothetical protein
MAERMPEKPAPITTTLRGRWFSTISSFITKALAPVVSPFISCWCIEGGYNAKIRAKLRATTSQDVMDFNP